MCACKEYVFYGSESPHVHSCAFIEIVPFPLGVCTYIYVERDFLAYVHLQWDYLCMTTSQMTKLCHFESCFNLGFMCEFRLVESAAAVVANSCQAEGFIPAGFECQIDDQPKFTCTIANTNTDAH